MSAPPANSVRAGYERLGALLCLSIAFSAVGAVLHHFSRLPGPYTWLEPLRTLRHVAQMPGFLLVVLGTYVLGVSARTDFRVSAVREGLQGLAGTAGVVRAVLGVLLVVALDFVAIGAVRTPQDLAALVAIGVLASRYRPSQTELLRQVGYVAVAAGVFMAICYFFTVLKALTFVSGRSYDASIMAIETVLFGAPPHRAIAEWVASRPDVLALCDWVYFRFFHHMTLTAVLLIAMQKPRERTEYLGALALCYVLGGPLYHVWPAAGPGYVEPQHFPFLTDAPSMASGVRAWLAGNTDAVLNGKARVLRTWGYIACMPSLHVAQEFVMLYYARHSRVAFVLSLAFTLVTLLAVVALGWHYPIDSIAGLLLAVGAIALARAWRAHLMPRGLAADDDLDPDQAVAAAAVGPGSTLPPGGAESA